MRCWDIFEHWGRGGWCGEESTYIMSHSMWWLRPSWLWSFRVKRAVIYTSLLNVYVTVELLDRPNLKQNFVTHVGTMTIFQCSRVHNGGKVWEASRYDERVRVLFILSHISHSSLPLTLELSCEKAALCKMKRQNCHAVCHAFGDWSPSTFLLEAIMTVCAIDTMNFS